MTKIEIKNEKLMHCPTCGEIYCKYNDEILLFKKVSTVFIDRKVNEITVKCAKCKEEIKIS